MSLKKFGGGLDGNKSRVWPCADRKTIEANLGFTHKNIKQKRR